MPTITVYSLDKEPAGQIELEAGIFASEINEPLLFDVIRAQLASRRSGTACTKTRTEVAGSTRKLYKQKGTGRARHGAITAPTYVGGGKAHGPKPRDYGYKPNKKMRRLALCSALTYQLQRGKLIVVDSLELPQPKTRLLATALVRLGAAKSALIIDDIVGDSLKRASSNLPNAQSLPVIGLNVYDACRYDALVLSRAAVSAIHARLAVTAAAKPPSGEDSAPTNENSHDAT